MKAAVIHGPHRVQYDTVDDPGLFPRAKLNDIITHRLPLSEIARGYEIFQKKEDDCVKVVLDPWR